MPILPRFIASGIESTGIFSHTERCAGGGDYFRIFLNHPSLLSPHTHTAYTRLPKMQRMHRIEQFQRGLILGHVELLEPMWKENPAPMRIFTAPLNSEVEVARNVHDLVRVLGPGKGKDVKVCWSLVVRNAVYFTWSVPGGVLDERSMKPSSNGGTRRLYFFRLRSVLSSRFPKHAAIGSTARVRVIASHSPGLNSTTSGRTCQRGCLWKAHGEPPFHRIFSRPSQPLGCGKVELL